MNDTSSMQSADPVDEIRARQKAAIFAALAELGVDHVAVNYDGSGNSGQIDEILASDAANKSIPLPSDRKVRLPSADPGNPFVETTLEDAVETLAWNYLEELYGGWENNDGAFGSFVFDIPSHSIKFEHNERFTDVNTTSHEF